MPNKTIQNDELSLEGRVLIIENDKSLAGMLKETLKEKYQVDMYEYKKPGLEALAQGDYHAVLLNSSFLEEKDRSEVLKQINKAELGIPVVVVSNEALTDEFKLDALIDGAYDFISKPFYRGELINKIGKAVESSKSSSKSGKILSNTENLERVFRMSRLGTRAHDERWFSGEREEPITYDEALRRVVSRELEERKYHELDLLEKPLPTDIRFLEKQVETDPENPSFLLSLGMAYIKRRDYLAAFTRLRRIVENEDLSFIGFSNAAYTLAELLLHRPELRRENDKQAREEPLNVIKIAYRWFKKKIGSSDAEKGMVEKGMADLAIIEGNIDEAIRLLEDIEKKDPDYIEVYFKLGEAYMKKGDKEAAYRAFESAIEKSTGHDKLEGFSSDAVIRQTQLIGMHIVYEAIVKNHLTSHIVIKAFRPEDHPEAVRESENLQWLSPQFMALSNGEQIYTPIDPVELLTVSKNKDSFLILENMHGIRVSKRIRSLDSEEQVKYLEWVIDASSTFQVKGTKRDGLIDVKDIKYDRLFEDEEKKIGFYTDRFFTKLVDSLIRYRQATFEKNNQIKIKDYYSKIERKLKEAPPCFYLWHAECNLRNFLLRYTGQRGITANADEIIANSKKSFIDFPSKHVRLGLVDIIAAIEFDHSLDIPPEENKRLIYLWGLYVLKKQKGENTDHICFLEQDSLYSLFEKELEEAAPGYGIDKFECLRTIASFQKHAELIGDRLKEIDLYNRQLEGYEKEHGSPSHIQQYQSATKEEKEKIRENIVKFPDEEKNRDDYILSHYIELEQERNFLVDDLAYHKRMVLKRLDELNEQGIRDAKPLKASLKYRFGRHLKNED